MFRTLGYVMEVINACRNLPRGAIWHIERALSWIDPADLDGIAFVQLLDEIPDQLSRATYRRRCAKNEGFGFNGLYFASSGDTPAHIMLFVQDVYRGIPGIFKWTTVQTLQISRTIAHEVGHHLIEGKGYIFEPNENYETSGFEEEMADRYAFGILKKMRERWYYKLGSWTTKRIASFHYIVGLADWKERNYGKAAERWYTAWHLDPDRQDAVDWYWQAKKILKAQASRLS